MGDDRIRDISIDLEILLEHLDTEIRYVNARGARALEAGDHEYASRAILHAGELKKFRDRVVSLGQVWKSLEDANSEQDDLYWRVWSLKAERRHSVNRLRRGSLTSS